MNQSPSAVEWIDEYLDWIAPVDHAHDNRPRPQQMRSSPDSVAAYLEWMDAERSDAPESQAGVPHPVRETALLEALRTESDCMHVMRRALDADTPNARTLELASEALEHARRLVERERGAWRALRGPYAFGAASWPDALEGVAADLHALTGKVMALQAHRSP